MRPFPFPAVLLALVIVAGCATAERREHRQRLVTADAEFARGCYLCLTNAFEQYRALATAGYQPAAMNRRAFETALLVAVREKELAMDAQGWIETARGLAPDEPRSRLYLEIADALPWAAGRHDGDFTHPGQAAMGPVLDALERWDAALGAPAGRDVAGTYLMAAARCALTPSRLHDALTFEALAPAHADAPLIQYVAGSCRRELGSHLAALASDPDFHEVTFHLARFRLFEPGNNVRLDAKVMLEAARAAMPGMVANTWLLAGVLSTLDEHEPCAEMYAEVIALGGAPRESLLNRTVCLTHAAKRADAIASATTLIDTPGILRGEAFYWRATNRYHLRALPDARADVEAAKPLYDDAAVYALSGFIAYEMDQKPYAYTEFEEAWHRNGSYCTAPFYQGLIDAEQERWEPAAARYETATRCYEISVRRLSFSLEQAQALDAADPTRQERIDSLTAALDGERLQVAHAAYNVAYANGRLGRPEAGIPFAEKSAAAHKDMRELATNLLAILRKGG